MQVKERIVKTIFINWWTINVSSKFIVVNGKSWYIIKATLPGLTLHLLTRREDRGVGRVTTDRIMIALGIFMLFLNDTTKLPLSIEEQKINRSIHRLTVWSLFYFM